MFCEKCGHAISENEQFCTNCGATQQSSGNGFVSQNSTTSGSKLYDLFVIIAAALMALGTLLPCYSISFLGATESLSYIEGDGIFILIAAIVSFVLYAINRDKFMAIPAGLAALLLIYFTSEISKAGIGSYSIGYYMMWIGTVAIIILPFTSLLNTKSLFIKK